jgi:hypothetical protein
VLGRGQCRRRRLSWMETNPLCCSFKTSTYVVNSFIVWTPCWRSRQERKDCTTIRSRDGILGNDWFVDLGQQSFQERFNRVKWINMSRLVLVLILFVLLQYFREGFNKRILWQLLLLRSILPLILS